MARSASRKPAPVRASYEATLVYYDEPQLVLFSRDPKKKIIATAVDSGGGKLYPFFGAEISLDQWDKYLREICDLRYLFEYPKYRKWFLFDYADLNGSDEVRMHLVDRANVPEHYIPAGQFFSRSHTEPLGVADIELGVEKFLIDGSWDFADFSAFYGKISDLYAIFVSISRYYADSTDNLVRANIRKAFRTYPLKGGSSYRFFYRDLFNTQSTMDRLNVDSIQYASPGHVKVHARHDIFLSIKNSLIAYRLGSQDVSKTYNLLRKFLSKAHLLTANAEDFDTLSPYSTRIYALTEDVSKSLSFDYLPQIMELTNNNALATAKIMLSYVRRVDRSFRFFAEGRVVFGGAEVGGDVIDLGGLDQLQPLSDDPLDDGPVTS